jgi:RNA polymerase sigma-70 factor, ECF subfamily
MNRLADYLSDSSTERTEAFVRLFLEHQSLIRGFLFTLLPNKSEVDDLFQRTSIVLWRKFEQFQPGTDFGSWAYQIAKLEVRNFLRVRSHDRHRFSDETLTALADARLADAEELESRRAALQACVAKLRPTDQKIVRYCYGPQATTAKDAARHLGRPVNTVYKALIRIRRSLFECIEGVLRNQ